jgi:hypothetical protein
MSSEISNRRLEELEALVDDARQVFTKSAAALYEIREGKLWKLNPDYEALSFAEYCHTRFPWARDYAYKMAKAGEIIKSLPEQISTIVENESQAREVAKVPEARRERVVKAAAEKAESEGKPLAARHIAEAAEEEPEDRPGVVAHTEVMPRESKEEKAEKALAETKLARWLKVFDTWLGMNFPRSDERKWLLPNLRDHIEDLIAKG